MTTVAELRKKLRADSEQFIRTLSVWKPMSPEEMDALTLDERHYLSRVFPGGNWFGQNEPVLTLRLPWSVLVHDNHRLSPRKHGKGLFQTTKYRKAKKAAKQLLAEQYRGPVLTEPLALLARFYVPNKVRRDVTNFAKCICDALTGVVIEDDRWQVLRSTTWEVAGVDKEKPEVLLFLTPAERNGT